MIYGYKNVYPQQSVRVSTAEDLSPPNWWLVIGACLVALVVGAGLIFALAWVASHIKLGPFLVAFIIALAYTRTFR